MFKNSYLAQLDIVPCMKILFGGKGNSLKFKGPGLYCPFFKEGPRYLGILTLHLIIWIVLYKRSLLGILTLLLILWIALYKRLFQTKQLSCFHLVYELNLSELSVRRSDGHFFDCRVNEVFISTNTTEITSVKILGLWQ